MRSAIVVSTLLALVSAIPAPNPQILDFEAAAVASDATVSGVTAAKGPTFDTFQQTNVYSASRAKSVAAADIAKAPLKASGREKGLKSSKGTSKRDLGANDPCGPQPSSAAPPTGALDTAQNFLSEPNFAAVASGAAAPANYNLIFSNQKASISEVGYLGLYPLDSYDPAACAALCDAKDLCFSFNIYLERDPSLNPAAACPLPSAINNVKCTLYGNPINVATVTNSGETRQQFQIVIAASNGYQKIPSVDPIPGYSTPQYLPGGAINAPSSSTYLGYKLFKQVYDPSVCAAACTAQTAYNARHPTQCSYLACNFFNAYVLTDNGVPQGMYCSLYSQAVGAQYAVNGGYTTSTHKFVIQPSFSAYNTTNTLGSIKTC